MSPLARIVVATSLLCWVPALAGPPPTPAPPAAPAAPVKAAKHITIKFQGTLREALKAIADKGGLNLVITGAMMDPAEVYLNDVAADEALQIVADAHSLKVHRQGSIWTIRPLTSEERARKAEEADEDQEAHEQASLPPVPPVPPVPPSPPDAPDAPEAADAPDAPEAPDAPSLGDADMPDPTKDPRGFERHVEERVQRDLRAKLMRKFRSKHFGSHGNDLSGTGHLVVEKDQTVGDAVSYGGGLEVKGHVEGDAVAYGGGVHLGPEAEVDGDVYSFGGGVSKDEGATIGGDIYSFGGSGLGRVVATSIPMVIHADNSRHEHRNDHPPSSGGGLAGFLAMFAVLFGSGFLSMMFAPNRMKLLEAEMRREPFRCGVIGFLGGVFGLPILSLLLFITIVGWPVLLALWVLVPVGCLMGIAAMANEIGTRLPLRNVRKTQAVVLALGVLLLQLVWLIPVVGKVVWFVLAFIALGALIRSRFGTRQLSTPVPV